MPESSTKPLAAQLAELKSVAILKVICPAPTSVTLVMFQLADIFPAVSALHHALHAPGCQFADNGVTPTVLLVAASICAWVAAVNPPPDGTVYAPVPSKYFVASFGAFGAKPCADVLTFAVVISVSPRSASTTAENVGAPAALPCNKVVVVPSEPRTVGAFPAPPPNTMRLAVNAPELAHVVPLEK